MKTYNTDIRSNAISIKLYLVKSHQVQDVRNIKRIDQSPPKFKLFDEKLKFYCFEIVV